MIKMYHDNPKVTGGPTEADVPEGGVAMMREAGWYIRESEPPAAKPEKPLDKMNHAELKAKSEELGVKIPLELTTKAQIAAYLIQWQTEHA